MREGYNDISLLVLNGLTADLFTTNRRGQVNVGAFFFTFFFIDDASMLRVLCRNVIFWTDSLWLFWTFAVTECAVVPWMLLSSLTPLTRELTRHSCLENVLIFAMLKKNIDSQKCYHRYIDIMTLICTNSISFSDKF